MDTPTFMWVLHESVLNETKPVGETEESAKQHVKCQKKKKDCAWFFQNDKFRGKSEKKNLGSGQKMFSHNAFGENPTVLMVVMQHVRASVYRV